MKKILFTLALALLASAAQAAQMRSCLHAIRNQCGGLRALSAVVNVAGLDQRQDCKWIRDGAHTVTFFDRNDIIATDLNTCKVNSARTYGRITDAVVFNGRLFMTTSENKVIMIGRNACIYEMKTYDGDSYRAARGLAVRDGRLIIKGTSAKLSEESIQRRIRSRNGMDEIACRR